MNPDRCDAPSSSLDTDASESAEQCTACVVTRPMRLLQMCTAFRPGGIQRHVLDLGAALTRRGHRVAFAGTPGEWLDEREANFLALDLEGVAQHGGAEQSATLPRRLVNAIRAAMRLRAFVRRERIELIHAHESAPALVAWMATIGMPIPILVTYHGSEPERVAAFAWIARLAARRVITTCQRCAEDLRRVGGVSATSVQVTALGIEPAPQIDATTRQRIRARLLCDGGRLLVVTVARLARQKGIDVLVEAARRIAARDASIRFAVVGDGPLRDDVERWIAEAGVGALLTLVGHSDRPHDYLAASDLFVLPSRWEALPIAIVEAFQHGLPVVATDAGGTRELVDDAVGAIVPIDDATALADCIAAICDDAGLRARLGANALIRAKQQRFSPSYAHGVLERTYASELAGMLAGEGRR